MNEARVVAGPTRFCVVGIFKRVSTNILIALVMVNIAAKARHDCSPLPLYLTLRL